MSMNTGHPIHSSNPCARGWEDSVRVLTTPQLMGILATRIGEQAQDGLPSPRPRQEIFSRLLSSVRLCLLVAANPIRCGENEQWGIGCKPRVTAHLCPLCYEVVSHVVLASLP